jgi:hypothetical protein
MKKSNSFLFILAGLLMIACKQQINKEEISTLPISTYHPDNKKLYDTIVHLDSLFFATYNTCNVNFELHASFYADSIEFYHDKGGLMTSKEAVLESTKRYVCGKVKRDLIKGSIEVYPINGFGAVEMGSHRFYNKEEPDAKFSEPGKFVILWRYKNKEWKISRVISLH